MEFQPLKDVRVIEWSLGPTAALCTRLMADLGAEVIKLQEVALPAADAPFAVDEPRRDSPLFAYCNSGKRVLKLDPDKSEGRAQLSLLLARSDLLVHTQPTVRLAGQGIHLDSTRCAFPSLSSVAILPARGEGRAHIGDKCLQFASGLAWHQARPVSDPRRTLPVGCADVEAPLAAGVAAAAAAVSSLLGRDGLGRGLHFEFIVAEFYSHLLVEAVAEWNEGERDFKRKAQGAHGPEVAGGLIWILPAVDGWIVVSPREQHQWERWTELMGSPVWASDPGLCGDGAARRTNSMKLQELMAEWSCDLPKNDIFHRAQAARVACFPVSNPEALLANEQLTSRGFFNRLRLETGRHVKVGGLPFRMVSGDGRVMERSRTIDPPRPYIIAAGSHAADLESKLPEETCSQKDKAGIGGILGGIRVADFSWVLAGPMTTKMLGAMGAEVVKIESGLRPEYRKREGWARVVNNNKSSVTCNLGSKEGRDLARRIVAESDVLVENFSAGVLRKHGLDYDSLRAINPRLIYVSASGMGRDGPQKDYLAYGTLLQSYSGRVSMIGKINPRGEAMGILPAWTDPVTAMWETLAILAALKDRASTGFGAYIDLSMLEGTVALLPQALIREQLDQDVPDHLDADSGRLFRCYGDDEWLYVPAADAPDIVRILETIGSGEGHGSDGHEPLEALRMRYEQDLAEWAASRSAGEAEAALIARGHRAVWVRPASQAILDNVAAKTGLFPTLASGQLSVALPWATLSGDRGHTCDAPPLGNDNHYVFQTLLGLDGSAIDHLIRSGAIA